MSLHLFTLAQANALVPDVEALLAEARAAMADARDAAANLEDLSIVWGEAISDPACEAHEEWLGYQDRLASHSGAVNAVLERFEALGIQVKDIEMGLVDFPARRGDDIVLLCYKAGEGMVMAWHTLEGGFAGRQGIEAF